MGTNNLLPFQKVLIRCLTPQSDNVWHCATYSDFDERRNRHYTTSGWFAASDYEFVPFEGNERLLGTSHPLYDKGKVPLPGDLIAFHDYMTPWFVAEFGRLVNGVCWVRCQPKVGENDGSKAPETWVKEWAPVEDHFRIAESRGDVFDLKQGELVAVRKNVGPWIVAEFVCFVDGLPFCREPVSGGGNPRRDVTAYNECEPLENWFKIFRRG